MIKELQKYNDLGTPSFLLGLIERVDAIEKESWLLSELQQLFLNQKIDDIGNVTGSIKLLMHIGVLLETTNKSYIISPEITSCKTNRNKLSKEFIRLLFDKLMVDSDFYDIFSYKYISFDSLQKSYVIRNSAFGYKYSKLRQLLVDFDFLIDYPKINSYLINSDYKVNLSNNFGQEKTGRKISVDEFNRSMLQRSIYGHEAESFVMNFEKERLNRRQPIEWVALVSVNDGYDIASYDNDDDKDFNRFIEVKSYAGKNKYFYLSANELKVSKRKKDSYWLYLVNRDKLSEEGYAPKMIQNPHEEVFTSSEWEKKPQNWKFQEIN